MLFTYDKKTLRQVQLTQLRILNEVDTICKSYNIKYHLFAGSLLGAIRHGGFIPWDDDIDICMSRKDYEKFNSLAFNELKKRNLYLQNMNTEKQFIFPFTKVRLNNTIFEEKTVKDLNIHKGIYIDIFPLDNVENSLPGQLQKYILIILEKINLCYIKEICLSVKNPVSRKLALAINRILKFVPNDFIRSLILKTMKKFVNKDTKYVTHLSNSLSRSRYEKYKMKREELNNTIFINFEGNKFPIPKSYDKVLKNLFGDYRKLPSEEKRDPHHGIIRVKF